MASRAHGVVVRGELLAAGVSLAEIRSRLGNGSLHREHRGVYRVGHRAPSVEATYLAAVRACGEGALLGGIAAAHLFGLVKGPPPRPEVWVASKRRIEGVRIRRCRDSRLDAAAWRGVPVTTVARTLVDLASVLGAEDLARACHEAGVRYGTTPRDVDAVLARRPTSPGARKLRRVLHGDVRVTLSPLERRFLRRLRAAGLPLPTTNPPAGGPRGGGPAAPPGGGFPPRPGGGGPPAPPPHPAGGRRGGGLPRARPPPHRRARQLPLPPLALRMGAGPPARAGGTGAGRRVPALHVGGPRPPGPHARRPPGAPEAWYPSVVWRHLGAALSAAERHDDAHRHRPHDDDGEHGRQHAYPAWAAGPRPARGERVRAEEVARRVGPGCRHEDVARAGGQEVGDIEAARAPHERRDALLQQQVLHQLGLGLVARRGDGHERALAIGGVHLARALARLVERRAAVRHARRVDERRAAVAAEALGQVVVARARGAHERPHLLDLQLRLGDLAVEDPPGAHVGVAGLQADDHVQRLGIEREVDVGLRRDRVRARVGVVDRAEVVAGLVDLLVDAE